MNIISLEKKKFIVKFNYNPDLVRQVKTLAKYKWHPDKKYWTVAASIENKLTLLKWSGFTFSQEFLDFGSAELKIQKARKAELLLRLQQIDLSQLFDYQKEGVEFIIKTGKGMLLDSPGIGKTVQAIKAFSLLNEPVVIITKAALKLNWKHEINKWLGSDVSVNIISGTTPCTLNTADFIIVNYNILDSWVTELSKFKHFIFDESQYVKNFKAKRTRAALDMVKDSESVFLLSATPVDNKVKDLASQLALIDRLDDFGGKFKFLVRYTDGHHDGFGWHFDGASNLEELHDKLKSFTLRRKKSDVLAQLPPQQYFNVYLDIDNRNEYDSAHAEFKEWYKDTIANEQDFLDSIAHLPLQKQAQAKWNRRQLLDSNSMKAEHLVRIEKLKQLSANGKLSACIEWIETFLESGEKLVVFCIHKALQKKLIKAFPEAVSILAEDSAETRDKNVQMFQNDSACKLIICSIDAAGEGITLTAASNTAIIEFPWMPSKLEQLVGRTHRIGSKGNSVNYYFLIADNTIDKDLINLLIEKKAAADITIDGVTDSSILGDLIKNIL
jgi:SWI/SNF-related matrix-associated actin-dependent regulator 1 of chromatin subfamily A